MLLSQAQLPAIAMAADFGNGLAFQTLRAGGGRLISQVAIEHITAHDPKRRFTGKIGNHRILQTPGEPHPIDYSIHRRREVAGEPLLN